LLFLETVGPDSEKLLAFAEKPENVEKLVKNRRIS
jgi:hypothetical protein